MNFDRKRRLKKNFVAFDCFFSSINFIVALLLLKLHFFRCKNL